MPVNLFAGAVTTVGRNLIKPSDFQNLHFKKVGNHKGVTCAGQTSSRYLENCKAKMFDIEEFAV